MAEIFKNINGYNFYRHKKYELINQFDYEHTIPISESDGRNLAIPAKYSFYILILFHANIDGDYFVNFYNNNNKIEQNYLVHERDLIYIFKKFYTPYIRYEKIKQLNEIYNSNN